MPEPVDPAEGEHLDDAHPFAAGSSGRQPRNRSNRWRQR
ncbi:hypothetical protein GA0070563_11292 [Micromonospora carbonacea]|uniref:Uncharacterized protein n=1 Tax=Micromonospora carbonacea TaxID=47853 RepID=A0A1C5ABC2_9ACTN|nr:hypothetical protein GA0070563_11292 [Micromonospora carbonacea]